MTYKQLAHKYTTQKDSIVYEDDFFVEFKDKTSITKNSSFLLQLYNGDDSKVMSHIEELIFRIEPVMNSYENVKKVLK